MTDEFATQLDRLVKRLIKAVIAGMICSGLIGIFPPKLRVPSAKSTRAFLYSTTTARPFDFPKLRKRRGNIAPSNKELEQLMKAMQNLNPQYAESLEINVGKMVGECLIV